MNTILDIARKVRRYGKRLAYKHPSLYCSDLCGLCGICSVDLFTKLKQSGFNPSLVLTMRHCFILCDKYIVDVTASQFGNRPVCVVDKDIDEADTYYWNVLNKAVLAENLIEAVDFFETWPPRQNPFTYLAEIKELRGAI